MPVDISKSNRALSVNQRLLTLGAAALGGFVAMLAVGWYQNEQVAQALVQQQVISDEVAHLSEMRIANLDMVLAAMDAIVDKDDGAIAPARIEIMKNSVAIIRSSKATVEMLAGLTGQSEAVKSFDADLNEVEKAVLTELPNLVQSKAPPAEFARIDDAIDGGGEKLSQMFATLAVESKKASDATVVAVQKLSAQSLYWQCGLGLIGILIMSILFAMHSTAIRRGVAGVRDSLNRILNDDLQTPVAGRERGDEFGEMANAAESLRLSSLEKREMTETGRRERERSDTERAAREVASAEEEAQVRFAVDALAAGLSQLADGDLTVTLDRPFRPDLEHVRGDFNRAVDKLQGVISEVKSNTSSIEANSSQMRSAADDLSKRTEQQAASLEQTSAALEQITSTVKNTSSRADEATQMVDGTRVNAEKSGQVVNDAMSAMQRIETASNEIGKIINVIDEIAFQTNLLALNAGVEAARAGEAGRGFAVVAQEVRELAVRAAGAAKDIKTLVARSSGEVQTGVQLVTAAGDVLAHIAADVARINTIVRSIATSANEQATGIQEINTAIAQMDKMTQQNAAMVEETNAASHTLAQDAGNLTSLIGQFHIGASQTSARQAPQIVTRASAPKNSPARSLVSKIAVAFNAKPAAKAATGTTDSNWEEF